jgi:hypothetical protein
VTTHRYSKVFGLASLVLLFMLNACASDEQATQGGGTALGAALGGLLGYAITGDEKGALVGAGLGGLGGFAVGNEVTKRKRQYADTQSMLDGEIQNTQRTNATLASANRDLQRDLAARQRRLASLESAARSGNLTAQQKRAELASLHDQQKRAQQLLDNTRKELEVQQKLLQDTQSQLPANDRQVGKYRARVEELQARVKELRQLVEQYAKVDDRISTI